MPAKTTSTAPDTTPADAAEAAAPPAAVAAPQRGAPPLDPNEVVSVDDWVGRAYDFRHRSSADAKLFTATGLETYRRLSDLRSAKPAEFEADFRAFLKRPV